MIEIERKYLVNDDSYKDLAHKATPIVQGFLNTHPDRTVRIRISGQQAWITVKGRSNEEGTERFEWEHPVEVGDAQELIPLCESGVIHKTRYEVLHHGQRFEVDEFHQDNTGLTLAELELESSDTPVEKPAWLGDEVTGDVRYYNSQLSKQPYTTWKES